jgi:hypothetical protein
MLATVRPSADGRPDVVLDPIAAVLIAVPGRRLRISDTTVR